MPSVQTIVASTDLLDVRTSHEGAVEMEYSNELDYAGIIYQDVSQVPVFNLLIPAVFFEERSLEENESEDLTDGVSEKLSSSNKLQKLLEIEFAPDYFHTKVQLALQHIETLSIDGVDVIKEESYERNPFPRPNKRYSKRKAKVWLTIKDSFVTNVS